MFLLASQSPLQPVPVTESYNTMFQHFNPVLNKQCMRESHLEMNRNE